MYAGLQSCGVQDSSATIKPPAADVQARHGYHSLTVEDAHEGGGETSVVPSMKEYDAESQEDSQSDTYSQNSSQDGLSHASRTMIPQDEDRNVEGPAESIETHQRGTANWMKSYDMAENEFVGNSTATGGKLKNYPRRRAVEKHRRSDHAEESSSGNEREAQLNLDGDRNDERERVTSENHKPHHKERRNDAEDNYRRGGVYVENPAVINRYNY